MKGTKSASRYAKALLDLAIEQNKLEVVSNDMQSLVAVGNESKDFLVFLSSPVIKVDKKIEVFSALFASFDQLTISFVNLIIKNRRENILPAIADSFVKLEKEHKGIVPVQVISSIPLNEETKTTILGKISSLVAGRKVELTEEVDPSLLGGFIVRLDDKQIDASVSNQFNNLKQRLTR